jgi:hypothetical protein
MARMFECCEGPTYYHTTAPEQPDVGLAGAPAARWAAIFAV